MHITRCQDQKGQTLEEFYSERAHTAEHVSREFGTTMLKLIERLRALPDDRHVYGLTSHERLCLLAQNTYQSPWFVIVWASDRRNYFVEYLMPEAIAPWAGAYVRGEARSEDEAVHMVLTAMAKSGGWSMKL